MTLPIGDNKLALLPLEPNELGSEGRKDTMVSAVVVIGKRSQLTLIVRAEDWLNPDINTIDGQDPYTGDTHVIYKHEYKIGWVLDENRKPNFSF